ncbi:hypothetical protein ACD661_00975 [Legionella lytica]|uniref:Secreted protein n=1 Tax=Legionella lytica TaxID=96232 RepID=A0ABW8D352_9GAMM
MSVKKWALSLALGFATLSSAFAGTEDWQGTFTVQDSQGEQRQVIHTPQRVQFMFFSVSKCMHFRKGSKINGVEFTQDVDLCTSFDIPGFMLEVQKLGTIVNKEVVVGSTYPA